MNVLSSRLLLGSVLAITLSACSDNQVTPTQHDTGSDGIKDRVSSLAMTQPDKALALIDSAERAGAFDYFTARLRSAEIYFNPLQEDDKVIETAVEALESMSPETPDKEKILMLRLLSNSYYFTGEYEACIKAAMEGEQTASAADSLAAVGEFRFIIGECMVQLGQSATGWANMDYGVNVLSKETNLHAKSTLGHFLGEEMTFMISDGKYQEALELGRQRENLLHDIEDRFGSSEYLDQQFGYLYGKMALLSIRTGDREKADDYARKFLDTDYSKDHNGRLRILEYYVAAGKAQAALEIFGDTDFPCTGDSVSNDGQYYLRLKAEACRKAGRLKEAYSLLSRAYNIRDSLERRSDNEKALKVFAAKRTHEVELEAKEAEVRNARSRLYIAILLIICLAICSIFLNYYLRTKALVEKKRLMSMERNDREKYIKLLQSANARINELSPVKGLDDKVSEADSLAVVPQTGECDGPGTDVPGQGTDEGRHPACPRHRQEQAG